MARFANTALGLNPSQVDYSDYRDLAGVKVPFHWTLSWTDGRSDFDLTDVQPNVPINASKFGQAVLPKNATPWSSEGDALPSDYSNLDKAVP